MYHATECIFDLIASNGPQSFRALLLECREQCTAPAFCEPTTKEECRNATSGAVIALFEAGIIDVEEGDYDLTDYGYRLLAEAERDGPLRNSPGNRNSLNPYYGRYS